MYHEHPILRRVSRATSLRGLRIDLARRLSDLKMTWPSSFAGVAIVAEQHSNRSLLQLTAVSVQSLLVVSL